MGKLKREMEKNKKNERKWKGERGIKAGKDWEIEKIRLFGGGMRQVLKTVEGWWEERELGWRVIATVNPEFVMKARIDRRFSESLERASLRVLDGVTLWWIKRIREKRGERKRGGVLKNLVWGWQAGREILKGKHLADMVPGSVLTEKLCGLAAKKGKTVFFLGGWQGAAKKTALFFRSRYPKLKVAGCYEGRKEREFDQETLRGIQGELKRNGVEVVDLLLVAYGMGNQEKWMDRNLRRLPVKVAMGVGRTFDYYSGMMRMAPEVWKRLGLEWLYSLLQKGGWGRLKRQVRIWQLVGETVRGA